MAVNSKVPLKLFMVLLITIGSKGICRIAAHTTREPCLVCVWTNFQASWEIITKYVALKLFHKFELRTSGKTSWANHDLYFTARYSPVFLLETILVDPRRPKVIINSAAFPSQKCPNLDNKLYGRSTQQPRWPRFQNNKLGMLRSQTWVSA